MSVAKYIINDHDVWMMATLSWPGMLIMTMIVVGEVVFVIFVVVLVLVVVVPLMAIYYLYLDSLIWKRCLC